MRSDAPQRPVARGMGRAVMTSWMDFLAMPSRSGVFSRSMQFWRIGELIGDSARRPAAAAQLARAGPGAAGADGGAATFPPHLPT